jgi:hypothetical protein
MGRQPVATLSIPLSYTPRVPGSRQTGSSARTDTVLEGPTLAPKVTCSTSGGRWHTSCAIRTGVKDMVPQRVETGGRTIRRYHLGHSEQLSCMSSCGISSPLTRSPLASLRPNLAECIGRLSRYTCIQARRLPVKRRGRSWLAWDGGWRIGSPVAFLW